MKPGYDGGSRRIQRSVFFYREQVPDDDAWHQSTPDPSMKLYVTMFAEDVVSRIMPASHSTDAGSITIMLQPATEHAEQLVAAALERPLSSGYAPARLEDALYYFLRECAQMIMTFGEAAYEIVALVTESSQEVTPDWVGFILQTIPPGTLHREGKRFVQEVPVGIASQRGVPRRIELPVDSILRFEPPLALRSSFPDMLTVLEAPNLATQFSLYAQSTPDSPNAVPYEFSTHIRTEHQAIAQATRQIGWNARMLFADDTSDYYLAERQLRFEQFIIELRDSILQALNAGFERIESSLGSLGHLSVESGPTVMDIAAARQRLKSGEASPASILKRNL